MLAPWMLCDFKLMDHWFIDHGLAATPDEIATPTNLLGHPPRFFEACVKETAARSLAENSHTTTTATT